jgi:hypothetical protein
MFTKNHILTLKKKKKIFINWISRPGEETHQIQENLFSDNSLEIQEDFKDTF